MHSTRFSLRFGPTIALLMPPLNHAVPEVPTHTSIALCVAGRSGLVGMGPAKDSRACCGWRGRQLALGRPRQKNP